MKGYRRIDILGCPIDTISFAETVTEIGSAISSGRTMQIFPANVDVVMKARRTGCFAQRLWEADLVVADGKPVVWAASLLGEPVRGRVNGTDLVWSCAALSAQTGWVIALIGGVGDVGARAARRMKERYPEARLYAVPTPMAWTETSNAELVQEIKALDAKIVLAALGAPRQENWIAAHLVETGSLVGIGVGSAFDIISGDRPRAPVWMQSSGLEWFHRMLQEPRRLGRRYLVEDTPFLYYLALAALRRSGQETRDPI